MFVCRNNVVQMIVFSGIIWGCFLFSFALPAQALTGKVVGNPAGDILTVLPAGPEKIAVSLYGIMTPGKDQPYFKEAMRFTADMVTSKIVDVEVVKKNQSGRLIGIVRVGGRCLNEELIKAGWAWVARHHGDKTPPRSDWLEMEKMARESKIGLWHDKNPMPPWRLKKLQNSYSTIKKQKLDQKDQ